MSHRLSQGFQLTSLQSLADGLSKEVALKNKQLGNSARKVYLPESALMSQNSGSDFKTSSMTDLNVTIDAEGLQQYYLSLGESTTPVLNIYGRRSCTPARL